MTKTETWFKHHWKNFVLWCEGEFIRRTIMAKQGRGSMAWSSVARRFTVADALRAAHGMGADMASADLAARYRSNREWAVWMARLDRQEIASLREHKSYIALSRRHIRRIARHG